MQIKDGVFIHPKAHVENSQVGAGTSIWQFASVIRGAFIGRGCNIASGACIDGSFIGDHTKIGHNLAMGPGFMIGAHCFIGPNVTFCNDAWPRADTACFDPEWYQDRPAIIMEDGASIGAGSVILPGVTIGAGAMVGAGSVVTFDVPAGYIWKGHGSIKPIADEDRQIKLRMRFAGS